MKKENKSEAVSTLRQKAEELMKSKTPKKRQQLSEFDAMKLVHELEVHQIELELQNEELFRAKEKAAELATEKYAELYDFAPTGYFTLSKSGDIVELNLCGSQMLGKERSLLKKRRFAFFVSDDTKQNFNSFLDRAFSSKTIETGELTLMVNGSLPKYVHLTGIATDNATQCLVIVADITEINLAEKALKESERFLKDTQMIAKLGTYSLDMIRDRWVSSDVLDLILGIDGGYKRTVDGWVSIIHPEWQYVMRDYFLNDVVEGATRFDKEYKIIRQNDKAERWVHGLGRLEFDKNHIPVSMVGTIRDITEQKLAEDEIQRKNIELQKINAEKDKFFSIIAHDLRSPFNGFLGLTEIMAEGLPRMSSEEIQTIAVAMRNSATNLFRLLGNLLEWSRMQRGLTTFNPEPVLLLPKISDSLVLILEAASKKEIAVNYNVPEDLKVFADPNMLGAILRNLVANAVKFTQRGGNIIISAKPANGNQFEISIHDTGIGMNNDMLDHLFQLDVNVSRKGTEGEPTTGLGLIICKDFVEKHGGKLWAESEERKGSVFHFILPGRAGGVR